MPSRRNKNSKWSFKQDIVEPFTDVFTTVLTDTIQDGNVTAASLLPALVTNRIFVLKGFEVEIAVKSNNATTGFTTDARFSLGVNIDGSATEFVPLIQPVVVNATTRTVLRIPSTNIPPRILGPFVSGATTPVVELRSQGLQAGESMTVQLRSLVGVYPRSM